MSEEDKQRILQAFDEVVEQLKPIVNAIVEFANKVIKAVMPIIKKIIVSIVRMLNDKKACKCLHIWLHTKNNRIKKKQSKRINKIILSYMPS